MNSAASRDIQLLVSSGKTFKTIWSYDIQYLEVNDGGVIICCREDNRYFTSKSLKDLIDVLSPEFFVVVSRSVAVNLTYIDSENS